jgi:eukaryotic-like serine/threonine-protein kinase
LTTQTSASSAGGRAVPGTIIGGRYQLRAAIGNGGMGTVWQAVDTVLRRDVAVKEVVLPPGMPPGERDSMHERTLREARAAAALSHPSVVQVYDVVTEDGRPWIVMELLQARSLSEIIISDGPLSGRAVSKIGIALLGALEVAHAAGVLHRDVKPANVLICADGRCVLTDFGVARMPAESNLTQPGMVLGSPHFISPERAIGAKFGPPSDLFSLGVTLYTAIEGRPPFDKGDPFETMRAIVEEDPLPPVRAGALAPVLMGLLEKDPAQRWNVNAARTALRDLMSPANRGGVPVAPPRQAVGGRALLAEGENVADRHQTAAAAPPAMAYPMAPPQPAPMRTEPDLGYQPAPAYLSADPVAPEQRTRRRLGATGPHRPGTNAALSASAARGLDTAKNAVAAVTARMKTWPPAARFGVPAGIAAVLILVLVLAFSGGGGNTKGSPSAGGKPSASAPPAPDFEVQTFRDDRGMSVSVPANWKKQSTSSYTNFVDPKDSQQRMRLNVESAGNSSAKQFLAGAERNLKNKLCDGYTRVGLTDITLDGQPAAQLEYTCGSSDGLRHGVWAAVTSNGKAYHFYLTVPDADYAKDLPIYQEMVSTFKLLNDG